jgi:DNA (cytosine-5)-methyltransferase 1
MQGLPAGWVTDVPGLTRSAKLRLLGNGVVPQQAYFALSLLLVADPADMVVNGALV